jgi:hypothetical protein
MVLGIRHGVPRQHTAAPEDRIRFLDCPPGSNAAFGP